MLTLSEAIGLAALLIGCSGHVLPHLLEAVHDGWARLRSTPSRRARRRDPRRHGALGRSGGGVASASRLTIGRSQPGCIRPQSPVREGQ